MPKCKICVVTGTHVECRLHSVVTQELCLQHSMTKYEDEAFYVCIVHMEMF